MSPPASASSGRYELLGQIAQGGMATVHIGRLRGVAGFSRLVAIKQALPHIAGDPAARQMIVDEARLASKIHHPNVVAVQDVEECDGELLLVMDYVEGATLSKLLRAANEAGTPLQPRIVLRIGLDICAGLGAAHDLTDEYGTPLEIIHRDVSPQNILVGLDGVARLSDFGIAKGAERVSATKTDELKGKVAYMAPEYVEGHPIDRRADVFALGVVLWEALSNERLFDAERTVQSMHKVLHQEPTSLTSFGLAEALDRAILPALAKDPQHRFASCRELRASLVSAAEEMGGPADVSAVAECVERLVGAGLARRRERLRNRLAPEKPLADDEKPTLAMPLDPSELGVDETKTQSRGAGAMSLSPGDTRIHGPGQLDRRRLVLWTSLALGAAALVTTLGLLAVLRPSDDADSASATPESTTPSSVAGTTAAPLPVPSTGPTDGAGTASTLASPTASGSAGVAAGTRRSTAPQPSRTTRPRGTASSFGFPPNPYGSK